MYILENVTKHFSKDGGVVRALDGVDLTIADGEFLAIQGPTGQGKSTLLQLLGGLDRPTSGSISLDGTDLSRAGEVELSRLRATAFGFVFQGFNLIPTLTASENVQTALVPLGRTGRDWQTAADEALDAVGLADRAGHYPGELSGGQQQRVAVARALVKRPKILLADEPTGNLDEQTRDEIIQLLVRAGREQGLTLIVVTHDSAVAARADRVAVMRGGRVSVGPGAEAGTSARVTARD